MRQHVNSNKRRAAPLFSSPPLPSSPHPPKRILDNRPRVRVFLAISFAQYLLFNVDWPVLLLLHSILEPHVDA